jgi:hypothetical protein
MIRPLLAAMLAADAIRNAAPCDADEPPPDPEPDVHPDYLFSIASIAAIGANVPSPEDRVYHTLKVPAKPSPSLRRNRPDDASAARLAAAAAKRERKAAKRRGGK